MAVWIFMLGVTADDKTCWYWTKNHPAVVESTDPCATFEDCISDAMKHGFDFSQPYHITALRNAV